MHRRELCVCLRSGPKLPAKEEENHCPKTDFRKAFDTVQWDNLLYILETRGFDHKWIGWLKMLMGTAKTAILLNGTPGPWIQIKRGLRQGDSLSPLLFIILVDVLQQVIKRFSIEKKLSLELNCPVIQYADDTLILIQGKPDQAHILKEILDVFATTTGLCIDYNKSTFVPINLEQDEQTAISNILGCQIATFPQTYLGLPLSDSELPRWALFPLLNSMDSQVDTLSIKGATSGGRLTPTKSVVSALPSHALACIKAPKWFYKEIDKRTRAYFWTGQKKMSMAPNAKWHGKQYAGQ
jgi:hypothetical protein